MIFNYGIINNMERREIMTTQQFLDRVKSELVIHTAFCRLGVSEEDLEVIQVWYCKTIQNHKGLFIIKNNSTQTIYNSFVEATYNGDVGELYLDFYEKTKKMIVEIS